MSNDPLHDPQFPDRPTHPDFWRLCNVALKLDGDSDEGDKSPEDIMDGLVDIPSLTYFARSRVAAALKAHSFVIDEMFFEALFMSSLITGISFEREGGHRT